jgi:exodeoxyribonuclease VII large subunit
VLGRGVAARLLTVSQLAARIRDALDAEIEPVWVAGELSNLRRSGTGHLYFTLKDDQSQLAAVMFRSAALLLPFTPQDGMEVMVWARPSLWTPRGALQLYVDRMEPRGVGALQLALEQLKGRLAAEGLFAPERKRPLPAYPRSVGIVTALGGAVIHDMRTVLRRRWPAARVVVRPVPVQGREAAPEIALAIAELARVSTVDVIIAGRGGGSLEDLWAFNEEVVARAIAGCRVPVVSAVGHEVDFTIADLVADARAPTPSAAAALVVPDRQETLAELGRLAVGLRGALSRQTRRARERLVALERGLGDPRRRLRDLGLRIDDLERRGRIGLARRVAWERRELTSLAARLARGGPAAALRQARARAGGLAERLCFALGVRARGARAALDRARAQLEALSPLACLARGYALVRRGDTRGALVRDAATLAAGERVTLVLGRGRARARIDETEV